MIEEIARYVKRSLSKRIMRSLLTVFSIMLGIMAIYALVSFGEGLNKYVKDIASEIGTDKLIVQPKGFAPPGANSEAISQDDVDFLAGQSDVALASPAYMGQIEARIDRDKIGKWFYVMTLPTEKEEMELMFFSYDLDRGRWFKKSDSTKAILGYNHQVSGKIWKRGLKLGDKIYVNNIQFEIIGFLESVGNPQDDSNVYIPDSMNERVFEIEDVYNFVILQTQPGVNASYLAGRLTERLRKEKSLKEGQETFFITTFEEQIAVFTNIITVLNAILVIIALISVVVAAVNIANTMYTAVLERTKEIGVMKALGAANRYIMGIFVFESGLLGLVGGMVGIGLGYLVSVSAGAALAAAGYDFLRPYFPLWLTVGCLAFAAMVGTLSGFLPARQASRLKPVDALRYE